MRVIVNFGLKMNKFGELSISEEQNGLTEWYEFYALADKG
jgi:hypothetical protein